MWRKSEIITVKIPAGPKENNIIRVVDLEKVDNLEAMRLIQTRYIQGDHTEGNVWKITNCPDCVAISIRARKIADSKSRFKMVE